MTSSAFGRVNTVLDGENDRKRLVLLLRRLPEATVVSKLTHHGKAYTIVIPPHVTGHPRPTIHPTSNEYQREAASYPSDKKDCSSSIHIST